VTWRLTSFADALAGYDDDFFLWTQQQARLLRERDEPGIDWENVADEIESLGRRDRRELTSRLSGLLFHLRKWRYQPEQRKGGWAASIVYQREELHTILREGPSLRHRPAEILPEIYPLARVRASRETGLVDIGQIPQTCPFTIDEILDPEYLPG
jgi:hypothetical protein